MKMIQACDDIDAGSCRALQARCCRASCKKGSIRLISLLSLPPCPQMQCKVSNQISVANSATNNSSVYIYAEPIKCELQCMWGSIYIWCNTALKSLLHQTDLACLALLVRSQGSCIFLQCIHCKPQTAFRTLQTVNTYTVHKESAHLHGKECTVTQCAVQVV